MAFTNRLLAGFLTFGLIASACSSDSGATVTDDSTADTSIDVTDRATSQLSLEALDETGSGIVDDTTGADTASGDEEPADDDGVEPEDSPLETPLDPGCQTPPAGRFLVNVLLDDADGGLHLREGAGTANDIILPLPTGTEVAALGGCEVTDTGREWYQLSVVADSDLTGWAAADWLEPFTRTGCASGSPDTSGLVDIRTSEGDFDGDGTADTMTVGNHEEGEVAIIQVEFADGGFAQGQFELLVGEILPPFRPIGASHDIALVYDGLTSGAATATHVGVNIRDCTVQTFEGTYENGGNTGSGGWCLESTQVGTRLWTWTAPPLDDLTNPPPITWSSWMYHDGSLVETPDLTIDGRWCVSPAALGTQPATAIDEPTLVGLEATDPWNLAHRLADEIGAADTAEVIRVDLTPGPDSTGTAVFDVIGLDDDAVRGVRLAFTWAGGTNGITATNVTSTAMCDRGVSEDGLCL